jgi:peptidyl-prolyl cis-trans isomerase SurA
VVAVKRFCLFAIILVSTIFRGTGADPVLLNGIAAIVNDKIITKEDVESFKRLELTALLQQRARSGARAMAPEWGQRELEIKQRGLEELIDRELILSEFRQKGYNLPETLIQDLVKERIRKEFGDRRALLKELQEQGRSTEEFRRRIREDLVISQMNFFNVREKIVISPKKIEAYYKTNETKFKLLDQVRLRMILINPKSRGLEPARKLASEIVTKVRAGAKFADLARENSDDTFRTRGGDRGWIEDKEDNLRKELRAIAFKLNAGQVSDPVELEGAIFILAVEEKRAAGLMPLNDVRNEIEGTLRAEEQQRIRMGWIKRLREKSFVRYL